MRRGRRKRHDDGVITLLLFFFFFLNAQNARTKVRLSSVVLFSLNSRNGKKNEEKFSSSSNISLLMKSSQRARTRNFCGYCASSFPSKKAIIRAHNTCDALRGIIKTYSSLSLSKLFYFIHKIIIFLRFPTSQRFHDALRGRWPRRFLIRSEHIPNRWDAHR